MYTIYSKSACPFCIQAKMLLTRKGIEYKEIDCDEDIEHYRKWIREELGLRTFPVVMKEDSIIGGFTDLQDHLS